MKKNILIAIAAIAAGPLFAAESGPGAEVANAAKQLAEKGNYSWKATTENVGARAGGGGGGAGGGRGGFQAGPLEGKTEKDGFSVLSITRGETVIQAVIKGENGLINTAEGWQPIAQVAQQQGGQRAQGGQPAQGGQRGGNAGRMTAATLQNFKTPAVEAQELLAKARNVTKAGDVYTAELAEEVVRERIAAGGRRGGNAAPPQNLKGTVTFTVANGVLSKYEVNLQGTMSAGGNDVNINRTTTVEIQNVGTTKVEVPEEARKRLS